MKIGMLESQRDVEEKRRKARGESGGGEAKRRNRNNAKCAKITTYRESLKTF